jgi:CRISPR-associated protein Csd1
MILLELKEYYDRKAADPDSGIAPEGWEWKEIPFVIVLDNDGKFLCFEDTREGEGAKKRGKLFLVPQGEKKTSGVKSNLLWDTPNYVLGVADNRGVEQKVAFVERIKNEITESNKKQALITFLSNKSIVAFEETHQWEEIIRTKPNMTFRFAKEFELYCQSEEIKQTLNKTPKKTDGFCLISGNTDKISETHTSIKGVWGAQSSGANIVSFNLPAFKFFGKEQGQNAPVGESAMFAYTTAINHLLRKDSSQRMQIGDASTMFWSEKQTQFEDDFSVYLSEPPKDDPDANTEAVKALFEEPKTGAHSGNDDKTRFYVLGLSPNAARISVRFWKTGTVAEFAKNIKQHFIDLEISKHENEPKYYSLWRLLVNAAIQDKSENIPPNIAGDFICSILDGTPYPATLLQLVLRRVKSDTKHRVKPVRAALIKAYLNRYFRNDRNKNLNEKEFKVSLDTGQTSEAYHFGRLFAALEKIQEEANPGLNATIRERYYGAACGSPVTVFPTLLRLKNHHVAKIENKGRGINFEKLLGEIMSHYDDFPAHLNLHDQGKFAIGYYHQRQDFFTKNQDKE